MRRNPFLLIALHVLMVPCSASAGTLPNCGESLKPIEMVAPQYPIIESPNPVEGFAVVAFTVSIAGEVSEVELIESGSESDNKALNRGFARSALSAVSQWRYAPQNRACRSQAKLTFELGDD